MEPILQTKKLDLRYGAFQALYGIDTDIFPNEITALIGPSGCGKSTYLKTLNRMNDLVPGVRIEGDVRLKGEAFVSLSPTNRSPVAILPTSAFTPASAQAASAAAISSGSPVYSFRNGGFWQIISSWAS